MSHVLAGFKCGKLALDGKVLKADTRKGMLRVVQGDELVHLQWTERDADGTLNPSPEDDLVVFPGECSLSQIGSSRNYVLKFPAEADRDMFFWMQEPDASADALCVTRLNDALEGKVATEPAAAAPAAAAAAAPAPAPAAAPPPATVGASSSNSSAAARPGQDLAASLSSALAAALSASAAPPASAAEQLAASLLSRMSAQGRGGAAGASAAQRQALAALASDQGPSLPQVLRPEVLAPLLSEPGSLERLAEYLPAEHRNQADMIATLGSHAFRQQVGSLSSALQTGQLSLAQFGLQAKGFSVADFLEAIQASVDSESKGRQQ